MKKKKKAMNQNKTMQKDTQNGYLSFLTKQIMKRKNIKEYGDTQFLTSIAILRDSKQYSYDMHYLNEDHKIVVVDPKTGEIMEDINILDLPFKFDKLLHTVEIADNK